MISIFNALVSAIIKRDTLATTTCSKIDKEVSCKMISHDDEVNIVKTGQLALKRKLGFEVNDCKMTNGKIKKKSTGIQPFLRRKVVGSENMVTFISQVTNDYNIFFI